MSAELTNEMRADTQMMISIAEAYYKDLSAFNTNMENKLQDVERNLGEIKRNWNDGNFDNFNKIVKDKISKLKEQIGRSRDLEAIIKDTIKEYKEALAYME